jgi:hypothetical protein
VWIDATIAFGSIFLLGVVAFTLHWWLGRQERIERERQEAQRAQAASR